MHRDHLGSVRRLTNGYAISAKAVHQAYGERLPLSGAGALDAKGYIGEREDAASAQPVPRPTV